jgi:hypothetical protein
MKQWQVDGCERAVERLSEQTFETTEASPSDAAGDVEPPWSDDVPLAPVSVIYG